MPCTPESYSSISVCGLLIILLPFYLVIPLVLLVWLIFSSFQLRIKHRLYPDRTLGAIVSIMAFELHFLLNLDRFNTPLNYWAISSALNTPFKMWNLSYTTQRKDVKRNGNSKFSFYRWSFFDVKQKSRAWKDILSKLWPPRCLLLSWLVC